MGENDRGTERNVTLIVGLVLLALGVSALFTGRLFPFAFGSWWRFGREFASPAGLILIGAAVLYFSQRHGTFHAPAKGQRLYRDEEHKMVSGVMAGLSDYLGIDVTVLRLAAVGLALINTWGVVVAYIVASVIVPEAPKGTTGTGTPGTPGSTTTPGTTPPPPPPGPQS